MDSVTVHTPEGASLRQELEGPSLRIGRSADNDLILIDDAASRRQAEIVRRPEGYFLVDLRSKNGTFHNERRVAEPILLSAGDRVRIGRTLIVFNEAPAGLVDFSDQPLHEGSGTTILDVEKMRAENLVGSALNRTDGFADTNALTGPWTGICEEAVPTAQSISQILFKLDRDLVFDRPLEEILEQVMDLAHEAVRYERGLLMLLEEGELVIKVRRTPPHEGDAPFEVSRTITNLVLDAHQSILTSDALADDRITHAESVDRLGIRSVMCVPLWNNRQVIGLVYVDSRFQPKLFAEQDLRVLTFLANVAAVKIENARLFQDAFERRRRDKEFLEAARIQKSFLPSAAPHVPGYRFDGTTLPCYEVGGDYYDYVAAAEGRFGFVLGDVAGKGLPAALLMTSFNASLRAVSELDLPMEEMTKRLNRLLCRNIPENRFITFFYAILDTISHQLSYVNAGHNPPWLIRRNGSPEPLALHGLPLGCFDSLKIETQTLALDPGDILVCFSDGVTEARDPSDRLFGEERLVDLVEGARDDSPSEIINRIITDVDNHCAGLPHQDDITLLLLKRDS